MVARRRGRDLGWESLVAAAPLAAGSTLARMMAVTRRFERCHHLATAVTRAPPRSRSLELPRKAWLEQLKLEQAWVEVMLEQVPYSRVNSSEGSQKLRAEEVDQSATQVSGSDSASSSNWTELSRRLVASECDSTE
jgi:hypothetical protein